MDAKGVTINVDSNTNILVYIKNINVNAVKVVQIVPFYSDKNT